MQQKSMTRYSSTTQFVRGRNLRLSSSELVSDGVDHVDYQPPFLSLNDNIEIMDLLNEDQTVSVSELEALVLDIMLEKLNIEKEYAIAEMLKSFDVNKYGTITQDEFIERCKKWIHKGKQLAEDGGAHSRKSLRQQPRIEKKQHELVKIEHVMSGILKHFQNQVLEAEGLVTDDGKPKIWHKKSTWKEVDSLMYEVEENLGMIHMLLSWGCIKSILQIILGVAIANFLAEPLIYNILDSSVALGLPTFNIPFALKFKSAVSLIFPASQKSIKTASLTFSEHWN
ncbi:unnamed protein product [Camellia sinensis]